MAVHVRYKFVYIYFPFSAQQKRERRKMTKFCAANSSCFYLELNAGVTY